MNLKKIIIFENKVLFNILEEIKEKFNFDLTLANKENINEIKKKLDEGCLIISNKINKEFTNSLILESIPIKLDKLVEMINLKFLKNKFNSQSNVPIGDYVLNLNSRKIQKENRIVDLTEREVNLIIFLKKNKTAVKNDKIQKKVWDYGIGLETHTVETHIYRLRKKFKNEFNDDHFILSSKDGYQKGKKKKIYLQKIFLPKSINLE